MPRQGIILRFRDLVDPTVDTHNEIISTEGNVWWGWWNKQQEQPPRNTLANIEPGETDVLLAHSGELTLFEAELSDIDFVGADDEMEAPDPELVPKYYRHEQYPVWFQFSDINQIDDPNDELQQYAYDSLDEPFFRDDDRFEDKYAISDYVDKRVRSVEEVIQQHYRTIHFLQEYDSDEHRTGKVNLVDSSIQAASIKQDPLDVDSNYIIVLSDMHFSDDESHNFAYDDDQTQETLSNALLNDLDDAGRGNPAAVLLNGDFTQTADPDEFERAAKFIGELRMHLNIDNEHVLITPGNHDISWIPTDSGNAEEAPEEIEYVEERSRESYERFFNNVYTEQEPNEMLSMGRRFILPNGMIVELLGLNSQRLQLIEDLFPNYSYVSEEQFSEAAESFNWNRDQDTAHYRIVGMHSHLLPVVPKLEPDIRPKYPQTLDAANILQKAANYNVDLMITSHRHQPFSSTIKRGQIASDKINKPIGIHGTGTAGSNEDQGSYGRCSYSIIEFGIDKITVEVRNLSSTAEDGSDRKRVFKRPNPKELSLETED